ncbi:MAG: ABC transporter ATP-binding protein [Planctomycetota bacterium]|jgi:ABC-2 type transport system ATP-binding protein
MSDLAVETFSLSKRFGEVLAVDGVSLKVKRGEIYGFLGLNGAGKSTTIRLILGIATPTAGGARVFGEPVRADSSLWRRVGHLVEAPSAYPELSVRENLDVARRLYDVDNRQMVDNMIELLGLGAWADRRAKTLSSGNRQRLGLARALLHDPELLILDEPANGLDPLGVVAIRELLRPLAGERGVTVFMSSHILAEVERLAERIGVVHHGRLIEEVNEAELERRRSRRLVLETRDIDLAARTLRGAGYDVAESSGEHGRACLELKDSRALDKPDDVARVLVEAGVPPMRLAVEQEDLEHHFLRLTGEGAS